ncbi:MAG: hypothetical protein HY716_15930 [Planctomycetes bacterium]|nr:hypothetical protein [Planctomycetota bacterium]
MKRLVSVVMLVGLGSMVAFSQDKGMGAGDQDCPLSKVEQRDYCASCKKVCGKDDVDKGACKACKGKTEKADVCVRKCFSCPKAHGTPKYHSKDCGAAPGCCKESEVVALVIFKCDECGASGRTQKDVKHKDCDGEVKKTCEKSGTFPHGGEEEEDD